MNLVVFFLILFILYFAMPKALQNLVLFAGNIAFCYMMGGLKMIIYLLAASLLAYVGAFFAKKSSKIVYVFCFLIILGFLITFKYLNFFLRIGNDVQTLVTGAGTIKMLELMAPVGISFYTLTILSYMLDVSFGIIEPEKNILNFLCFSTYFGQLLSGPFNRYKDLGSQFRKPRFLEEQSVYDGAKRVLWGFFKKKVISDRLSLVVAEIFCNYQGYQGIYLLYGIICFALQLYADFSGYTDIVLGASQILGIELPENFKAPFFSRHVTEFWRRWHITLGFWCKDYIYYPFLRSKLHNSVTKWSKKKWGKKVSKKVSLVMGMFVIWFTVGFWHGGAWKYIIGSGLLHGFYIVTSEFMEVPFKKVNSLLRINEESRWFIAFQRIRTFFLVCVGFIFFRSQDVPSSIEYIKRLFMFNGVDMILDGSLFQIGINTFGLVMVILALIILYISDRLTFKYEDARIWLNKQSVVFRYAFYWILVAMTMLSINLSTEEFLYMQF